MATVKEEIITAPTPAPVSLDWLAIIYRANKERDGLLDDMDVMAGVAPRQRMAACRHFQLPPVKPAGWAQGQAMESRFIQLNHGANLGIAVADWQALLEADAAKGKRREIQTLSLMLQRGAIEVIVPDIDSYGEPGYRHFSRTNATILVAHTFHEDWIDKWALLETRPEIIETVNKARAKIIERKRKAAA